MKVLLLLICVILASCAKPPFIENKCIKKTTHVQVICRPIMVGKSTTITCSPLVLTKCLEYKQVCIGLDYKETDMSICEVAKGN